MIFKIKKGSARPRMRVSLVDDEGAAIDLTGVSSAYVNVAEEFDTPSGSLIIRKALTVETPATLGLLTANWLSSDTAVPPKTYKGQVEVVFPDGQTGIWGDITFIIEGRIKQ
jgi:hypothetical protein